MDFADIQNEVKQLGLLQEVTKIVIGDVLVGISINLIQMEEDMAKGPGDPGHGNSGARERCGEAEEDICGDSGGYRGLRSREFRAKGAEERE